MNPSLSDPKVLSSLDKANLFLLFLTVNKHTSNSVRHHLLQTVNRIDKEQLVLSLFLKAISLVFYHKSYNGLTTKVSLARTDKKPATNTVPY